MINKQFKFDDKFKKTRSFQAQFDLEDQGKSSPVFKLVRDFHVIKTWFKLEGKIQNPSKVITFTRNHTDDANDDRTKNNVSSPVGVRHNLNRYTCNKHK